VAAHLVEALYNLRDISNEELEKNEELFSLIEFSLAENHIRKTKSQSFQDIWVLFEKDVYGWRYRNIPKTFLEFGATDGIDSSNTWLLESNGWQGFVSEPNPVWHSNLSANRLCKVRYDAIGSVTGEKLDFILAEEPTLAGFSKYMTSDYNRERMGNTSNRMEIETISLCDFMEREEMGPLGYLSIDTEGSEFAILESFFHDPRSENFPISMITVEHNFQPANRQAIFDLLSRQGYRRKFTEISRWDDFYIKG
jgi:FkbM family methyltransferase